MSDRLRHPWAVLTIVIAALAAWIGAGSLHDLQHADSLLTVLISTQRWTPFFWGQDRFGMLVPLLAMPLHHPLANLLAQGWMMTAAALLAPFIMARAMTGGSGDWIAIGACTNILFLALATPTVQFDWLAAQPYGLSFSLGFAGLVAAGEGDSLPRGVVGFALLALACWVNTGVVVLLAIATAIAGSKRLRLLALEAAAAGLAALAARYAASAHTVTALAAPGLWLHGWRQLLAGSAEAMASPAATIDLDAGAVAVALLLWKTGRLPAWRPLIALAAMAIGSWLVVGTSLWVGMNRYVFRYMYPTMMISGVLGSALFVALVAARTKWLPVGALAVMTALGAARYGTPSLERVNRGIDERFGRYTAPVLRSGATVIAGDYWRVWPAVFHVNLALARAHSNARVFGLAFRSEETERLWKRVGQPVLLAGSPDDTSIVAVAADHGIAATLMAHQPQIDLYAGQPQQ